VVTAAAALPAADPRPGPGPVLRLVLPAGGFCPEWCPVHGGYDWRSPPPAWQAAVQRGLYAAMGL
jgi:hypothetical protein